MTGVSGGRGADDQGHDETDEAIGQLHRAGRSIGSAAFTGEAGLVWVVTGTNGENMLRAEGATQAEAWRAALSQARAVGMLGRVKPWQVGG